MRAAAFVDSNSPLYVEDVVTRPPGLRDVVVRLTASGICHTDLGKANGHYPFPPAILGHEGVGVVESIGADVRDLAVGDRVVGLVIPTCRSCWFCEHDEPYLCVDGTAFLDTPRACRADGTPLVATNGLGTFAETMTSRDDSLIRVESDLPDEQLALVGCGVVTGAGAVFEAGSVAPGSSVLVIGCGGVGQSVIQASRIAGAAEIVAVDPVPWKRALALQLGATTAIDPSSQDVLSSIRDLTTSAGADVVFDAVGHQDTMRQAVNAARNGGTAVLIGMPDLTQDLPIPSSAFISGKRVVCAVYGNAHARKHIPLIIDLVERGRMDLAPLVTQIVGLSDINEALRSMADGNVIRSVIKFT